MFAWSYWRYASDFMPRLARCADSIAMVAAYPGAVTVCRSGPVPFAGLADKTLTS